MRVRVSVNMNILKCYHPWDVTGVPKILLLRMVDNIPLQISEQMHKCGKSYLGVEEATPKQYHNLVK